jgi:hypothetical protein
MISSELIVRTATMKNPTAEKIMALQHALQVNTSPLRDSDPVCIYRNYLHHFSMHCKNWKTPDGNVIAANVIIGGRYKQT